MAKRKIKSKNNSEIEQITNLYRKVLGEYLSTINGAQEFFDENLNCLAISCHETEPLLLNIVQDLLSDVENMDELATTLSLIELLKDHLVDDYGDEKLIYFPDIPYVEPNYV